MLVTAADGSLSHLVGAMGGDAQPQILLQLLARMLPGGQDPADRRRRCPPRPRAPSAGPFRLWWGDDLTVRVEAHAPPAWMDGLAGSGPPGADRSAPSIPSPSAVPRSSRWCGGADDPARHYVGAADPRSPEGGTAGR